MTDHTIYSLVNSQHVMHQFVLMHGAILELA